MTLDMLQMVVVLKSFFLYGYIVGGGAWEGFVCLPWHSNIPKLA